MLLLAFLGELIIAKARLKADREMESKRRAVYDEAMGFILDFEQHDDHTL